MSLLAFVGVMLLGAFPVRAYLDQQHERDKLATDVQSLSAENQRLVERVARLQADDTIERLARERYHLVRPGEEAYAILPEADVAPPVAPAASTTPAAANRSWLSRAWSKVTSIV